MVDIIPQNNQPPYPPAPPEAGPTPVASVPTGEFKPNIYPIMYWALAFGAAASVLLFVLYLLSQVIAFAWVPVFMTGLIWGGYRNYKKQKQEWSTSAGVVPAAMSPLAEFRQAASDVAQASRDLMEQESPAPQETTPEVASEPETPNPSNTATPTDTTQQ